MKEMSIPTRMYLFATYLIGALLFSWNLLNWQTKNPVMLVILCLLASLAMIIKVEGTTNRSHYTFSFIVYGFAFAHLGLPRRPSSSLFPTWWNIWSSARPGSSRFSTLLATSSCSMLLVSSTARSTLDCLLQAPSVYWRLVLAWQRLHCSITLWLASLSGWRAVRTSNNQVIFDLFPLIIDLSLLSLGAMMVLIWDNNPYALLLFTFPIYMIYGTMRVPALERQSETDQKTNLFNHAYFMQQLEN